MPGPDALALATQLPADWSGQPHFTVLSGSFGQGQAFRATLQAWRACAQRPHRLVFVSCATQWPEEPPPDGEHWPPPTPNLHLLDFEGGRVRLLLAMGLSAPWRQLRQVQADALWLDGGDFGDGQSDPRQTTAAMKAMARLTAPWARLALWRARPGQTAALQAAGFIFDTPSGDRQTARFQPVFQRAAATRLRPAGHAVVVGAGIAGACAAAALAQRGWRCTVLDARAQPAGGASGNPAAIFHGTVHAADGPHARFTRAAALVARRVHAGLMARGVPGRLDGLLRAGAEAGAAPWPSPPGWASVWPATQLLARGSGLHADSAWFFPGGGWIDAAAAVRALLAGPGIEFRGGSAAAGLRRQGEDWQVVDAAGQPLAEAGVVVLAGAGAGGDHAEPGMNRLLLGAGAQAWPSLRARGQVSWFRHDGPPLPWPVAGGGYALTLNGPGPGPEPATVLCGATTQAGDEDPQVRDADHAFNLARLRLQTGMAPRPGVPLEGRVAWRERVADRLPVMGAAVDALALRDAAEGSAPRGTSRVTRVPGLFVLGAMAGRGFTWGPLAGDVLASWIDGTPMPLEADLLDAVDPARFWLRQARRGSGTVPSVAGEVRQSKPG